MVPKLTPQLDSRQIKTAVPVGLARGNDANGDPLPKKLPFVRITVV
jgi:hypothetical protein